MLPRHLTPVAGCGFRPLGSPGPQFPLVKPSRGGRSHSPGGLGLQVRRERAGPWGERTSVSTAATLRAHASLRCGLR